MRTLIKTIQFTAIHGSFGPGDTITVYYDPDLDPIPVSGDTLGYVVKLNGVEVLSGEDIDFRPQSYKNTTLTNALICNGTTLIGTISGGVGINAFPYARTILYPDNPSCVVPGPDPVVCNLSVYGLPQVTPATSEVTADGAITVGAVSTMPIKYKLGSDFVYGDGTGQTTGIFVGLLPGSYRIYLRDSNNCDTNVFVQVPVDTSYGDWKSLTYFDRLGSRTLIKIQKKNFAGTVEYVKGSGTPFTVSLRAEGNDDKFTPVLQTTAEVNVTSETNFAWAETFTNNPKKYRVKYYKLAADFDYVFGDVEPYLKWVGYLLPQQQQEDYKAPPYHTTLRFKDGLSDLKNLLFVQDDGQDFFGRMRTIELIGFILRKTGLSLNIRSGCNIYAEGMSSTDSDDPLDQAYIDPEAYYLNGTPTLEFVLMELLRPYRASLIQWDGRWNILRREELVAAYDYRTFSPLGVYQSNGSEDPVVDIDKHLTGDCLEWVASPFMELRPGYGKARVIYHLGSKPNILRNGDFRTKSTYIPAFQQYIPQIDRSGFQLVAPYPVSEDMEILKDNVAYVISSEASVTTGEAYIQSDTYSMAMGVNNTLKISLNFKLPVPMVMGMAVDANGDLQFYWHPIQLFYQKVRMVVQYGNRYLQSNGTWTITYSEVVCYCNIFGGYAQFEIIAPQPDSTFAAPQDFKVKVFQSWANHVEFTTLAGLKARVTDAGNDRGSYNASSNLFPSTGGSGGGGSILQGDYWTISTSGTLGGVPVTTANKVVCAVTSPGQDSTKWAIITGSVNALPVGTRTELRISPFDTIGYYELQENTDAPDDRLIIRPTDYNVVTNPVQWIRVSYAAQIDGRPTVSFFIDKISVEFLDNGQPVLDTIIRELPGEEGNNLVLQEEVYHGSALSLIVTNVIQAVKPGKPFNPFSFGISNAIPQVLALPRISNFTVTQSVLSAQLVYTGYISDALGEGYSNWSRDAVLELTTLHDIFMKSALAQYKSSWRKISGSLVGSDAYLGFINTLREVQQGSIISLPGGGFTTGFSSGFGGGSELGLHPRYIPQALTINDIEALYDGEFLELMDITQEGLETVPFTSGFTVGFGGGFD